MNYADIVLKSNAVFTSTGREPIAGSVAIRGNRILWMGPKGECEKYVGDHTRVLDFQDKLIMPGFIDAHDHYFMGAVAASEHMCTGIIASSSEEDCVQMMQEYARSHPDEKRILGMGWFPANWNDAPLPSKHSLDRAFPDKPVYLIAADAHTVWLNSLALAECGITEDTKVEGGEIGKLENGELSGLLFELGATTLAFSTMMSMDVDVMKEIHRDFLKGIAASGVTTISEMTSNDYLPSYERDYEIVNEMAKSGELTARLHVYTRLEGYTDFTEALKLQKKFFSDKFRISGVKGFVDGVSSTFTAYMLEPYSDKPETCGIGVPFTPKEEMQRYIIAANAAGLPVKLHCIGDAGVRMALDMYEASLKENPNHGLVNTVEHIESLHPDDIPRFAELGVIPSMQPYHLTLDVNEKVARIGMERCRWEWPHKSLMEAGATLAFGTDYPVVGFDPFPNLYSAITRCDDDGKPTGVNPEECVELADAIIAYTKGAARSYMRDDIGTIEEGKLADIVVVDRNLFAVPVEEVKEASALMTIMDGKVVFERAGE